MTSRFTPIRHSSFSTRGAASLALAAVLGAGLAITAAPARAQSFPTKAVRIVTPFPAGSGPEVAVRLVADRLSKIWGQPVIVDNRPGASERVAGFADVPTVAESGGPAGFELSAWNALLAPKGTPRATVEKIQKDVASIMDEQDFKDKYAGMYYEPYSLNTEGFLQQLRSDSQRYGETIKRLNISLD